MSDSSSAFPCVPDASIKDYKIIIPPMTPSEISVYLSELQRLENEIKKMRNSLSQSDRLRIPKK